MANGQIVSTKDKGEAFKALLERNKPQIAVALPKHLDAERFARMAINAALAVPEILDCTGISQIKAIMAAATVGLEPGVNGECWILPFKDNKSGTTIAQFIPGYRGLVQLCYRSDQVANIGAHAVYENDHFEYEKFPPKLVHREAKGDRGELVAAYAFAKLKGATEYTWEVLTKDDINRIKKSSRGAASKYSPWNIPDFEPWMWKKSALRQLCKLLPMSVEVRNLIDNDHRADQGLSPNIDFPDLDPMKEVKQPTPAKPTKAKEPEPVETSGSETEDAPAQTGTGTMFS